MKTERAIRLLELEKQYALKQRGFQQKPINKEVRQALDIAIEAVKQQENYISKDTYEAWLKSVKAMAEADLKQVVRCKDCCCSEEYTAANGKTYYTCDEL